MHLMTLPVSVVFHFQRMPCMQVQYQWRDLTVHQLRLQLHSLAQKGPTALPVKLIAQVALLDILRLQLAQSEHQQQPAICVRLDILVMSLSAVAVDAPCVPLANLQITVAQLNVRPVGKGHMLRKVHRSASLVMQEGIPTRRLLHAYHAVQDFLPGEEASVSHVLGAHTALQMATCARQVLLARFVRNQEQKLFNAGQARIRWSWVERHVGRAPKACTVPPVGPATASRAQQARHLIQGLVHVTLVPKHCRQYIVF